MIGTLVEVLLKPVGSNTGTVTSESLTITLLPNGADPLNRGLSEPTRNSKGALGGFVGANVSPPPVPVAWVRQFTASAVSARRAA